MTNPTVPAAAINLLSTALWQIDRLLEFAQGQAMRDINSEGPRMAYGTAYRNRASLLVEIREAFGNDVADVIARQAAADEPDAKKEGAHNGAPGLVLASVISDVLLAKLRGLESFYDIVNDRVYADAVPRAAVEALFTTNSAKG